MIGVVANRRGQDQAGLFGHQGAHRRFLIRTDLEDQMAAGFEPRNRLGQKRFDDPQAVVAAVEGAVGFVVADAGVPGWG